MGECTLKKNQLQVHVYKHTGLCMLHTFCAYFHMCRVLKEALKASGGNLTEHHTEDVSMCALLLMEAAKKRTENLAALNHLPIRRQMRKVTLTS